MSGGASRPGGNRPGVGPFVLLVAVLGGTTPAAAQAPQWYPAGQPPAAPTGPVVVQVSDPPPPSFPAAVAVPEPPRPPAVLPPSAALPSPSAPPSWPPPTAAPGGPTPFPVIPVPRPAPPPPVAPPEPAAKPAGKPTFEVVWNNGLYFQTQYKDYVLHLGGSFHYDAAWYDAADALQQFPGGTGPFADGTALRRGRFRADGTVYKDFDFVLEFEFANGFSPAGLTGPPSVASVSNTPGPTEAYVTVKHVPGVGNVRAGLHKEPFSLEQINSHRYLEFMERSYLFDAAQPSAFSNGRSVGVSVFRTWAKDRLYTAAGVFKNPSNTFGFAVGDGEYAATGRLGYLPVWCPDQKSYWFVGGAMSYRDPVNDQVRLRVRNSVRAAPVPLLNVIADTGAVTASSQTLFNLQTAAVRGPLTVQAEYLANLVHGARVGTGPDLGTVPFQGYYVEALCFLTGESRPWDTSYARFGRVVPKRNFGFADGKWCGGWGAWELGVRYNFLDLTQGGVAGGRLQDVTVGLNWYWNPNMKMQFNYDYVYRDESGNPFVKGSIHSFGTRLAVDF